jgi:hypothetical protein
VAEKQRMHLPPSLTYKAYHFDSHVSRRSPATVECATDLRRLRSRAHATNQPGSPKETGTTDVNELFVDYPLDSTCECI